MCNLWLCGVHCSSYIWAFVAVVALVYAYVRMLCACDIPDSLSSRIKYGSHFNTLRHYADKNVKDCFSICNPLLSMRLEEMEKRAGTWR